MGDTAVDFFQETLKELIMSSKLSLVIDEKHQLQSLEKEIKYLRGFLKDTEKKRKDYPKVMKLVMQIRDLVSKAENIVELFVVHAFRADHAPYSLHEQQDHISLRASWPEHLVKKKKIYHLSLDLESVKKGMKTLTAEVKQIYDENMCDIKGITVELLKHSSTESGGSSRGGHTSNGVKEKVVVGFEEEVDKLIEKLDGGEGKPLEIISIIGAGGGGKTTLAKEVYDHPFTSYTFEIRAWIDVSQDYDETRKRDLLIRILESVNQGKYEKSSADKLGEDILKCLKGRRYLIVMDDIWAIEAWNDIQRSFPRECNGSKVLFTSRLPIQPDSISYIPHFLATLPENWCWELLQKKVFGKKCCPPELVDIGKQIAKKCKGLPLAIVSIAGILATEDKTRDMWEKVAKHLSSIIAKNEEGCMELLELSYNHLPLHLKACFLYIGGYPQDNEIPIRELKWLWIAEGFIQQSEGGESLETIAEDYLNDLINRSLVQVARKSSLGGTKACRIHDLLHELCLKKAEDDNFLKKVYEGDSFSPFVTNKHRRLFIGHQFEKFSLMPHNLLSLLCPSLPEGYDQPRFERKLIWLDENFELLRVFSVMSAKSRGKIGVGHLVHLRYLAYQFVYHSCKFPFSNLLNLETINLDVPYEGYPIPLPSDIFKMVKLRHLYTKKGEFTFHHFALKTGVNDFDHSSKLDSLQTLRQVCACPTCRSLLASTPNLRRLRLYEGMVRQDNVLSFHGLDCLKCLEKLTFAANQPFDFSVQRTLLPGLKLPSTLTRITLKYTGLKWEELSLLQTLPSLEVLKLMKYACCGPVWNISELDGFPQLKYLKFCLLDIEEWNASEDQFPKLEVLVLQSCQKLGQIPIDFGNLNELREIKLNGCGRSVEKSAKEIQKEQRNRKGDDYCLIHTPRYWEWPAVEY